MLGKRLVFVLAGVLLAIAATLVVLPLGYTAVNGQSVGCGTALLPDNPTPPLGSNDECDAAHVSQWSWVSGVALLGMALGGYALLRARAQRQPTPLVHQT